MNIFDKFFTKFAYKFDKGYPDMNNAQDVLLLERILKEEFNIILEAGDDISVHETLYTLIIDLIEKGENFNIPKNLSELEILLTNYTNSELSDEVKPNITKDKVLSDIRTYGKRYFIDKDITKDFGKVFEKTWIDAKKAAESTTNKFSKFFPNRKIVKVKRVADGERDLGVADNIITLDNGEEVWVSLKMGPGQFNSLSLRQLAPLMFTYQPGELDKNGYLPQDIETLIDRDSADKALKMFTDEVNRTVLSKEGKDDKFIDDKLNNILNNPKYNKGQDNLTPSTWKKWHDENPSVDTHKGYRSNVYRKIHTELVTDKKKNEEGKIKFLNPAINDYFENRENQLKKNILKILYYILRLNETKTSKIPSDKGYLYVADGGKKFFKIPSRDQLARKAKNIELKLGPLKTNKSGGALVDFVKDLEVYGDGKKLADIPIKFRFDGGQWNGGLKVKGDAPTFYDDFISYFDVPEEVEQSLPMD